MNDHRPLNQYVVKTLAEIIEAAERGRKVAWLDEHYPDGIAVGTARHLTPDEDGAHLGADRDVRDAYLRVTMTGGFEQFVPVSDLLDRAERSEVSFNYER